MENSAMVLVVHSVLDSKEYVHGYLHVLWENGPKLPLCASMQAANLGNINMPVLSRENQLFLQLKTVILEVPAPTTRPIPTTGVHTKTQQKQWSEDLQNQHSYVQQNQRSHVQQNTQRIVDGQQNGFSYLQLTEKLPVINFASPCEASKHAKETYLTFFGRDLNNIRVIFDIGTHISLKQEESTTDHIKLLVPAFATLDKPNNPEDDFTVKMQIYNGLTLLPGTRYTRFVYTN